MTFYQRHKTAVTVLILVALFVAGTSMAQLQTSGGSTTVTANAGTNLNTSALALESGGNLATIAGAVSANKMNIAGTVSINSIPAGSNIIGTVSSIPKTACGTTVASQSLAAVPTSATAVFSSTTCVMAIVMNNTTGSSVTITVSDNQGTPVNDILTFSIPASSQLIQPLYGVAFTSGLKWSASGSGVTGAILGYQ